MRLQRPLDLVRANDTGALLEEVAQSEAARKRRESARRAACVVVRQVVYYALERGSPTLPLSIHRHHTRGAGRRGGGACRATSPT